MLTRSQDVHIKRFRVEASIAGKLKISLRQSPSGVNATGNPFIVYKYLSGITLKELVGDDRPFDAKSVAEALGKIPDRNANGATRISRPDMDLLHDFRLNTLQ